MAIAKAIAIAINIADTISGQVVWCNAR